MSRKNIANYTTFNSVLINNLEIQSKGIGLSIFDTDPVNPVFSFNPTDRVCNIFGALSVTGDASFETITVSEFPGGMQSLAANNAADILDIGVNGNYNDGTSKYTGIIRDASDSLKRWTFFKNITTPPTTTIEVIDSTKLDSVRMNYLYVNNGSATSPSITFHNDTNTDTGLYLVAENEMGFTAGGKKIAGIKYISSINTEFQLDTTTTLKLQKFDTIDDVASVTMPSINTGHLYLKSNSASDKWIKFYSYTDAATPSYSGAVFTSPNNNYFLLNTGTNLELVRNTTVTSDTAPPDYRDSTTSQLLIIGSSSLEVKNKVLIPLGSISAPSLAFAQETTTGLARSGTNSLAVAINNANIFNVSATGITTTQAINNINGTSSLPSYTFTSNTGTGISRDNSALYENITFSANGTSLGYFWLRTTPQWITGSSGTAAIPSIAWSNDIYTGLFSPTNEAASSQLAISLNTMEIARFRRRSGTGIGNIEFFNSFIITPDGVTQKASFKSLDSRIGNTFKTNEAWFQAYNLIDPNPVFLFTFRSNNSVGKDYSNNGYDATLVGTPTIATISKDTNGVIKRDVLDLTNNTTKYFNLTSNLAALTPLDNTSISFWFKISGSLSTDNTIFSCYKTTGAKEISIKILSDGSAYPNALQVTVMSDSLTTLQYHTATASDLGSPVPIAVKDGLWHHVVIHLGSATNSINPKHLLYFDGVELNVASNKVYITATGSNGGNPEASVNSFDDLTFNYASIGAVYNGSSGSLFYTGYLKDFYITGRLVSATDVTTLYTEPYVYTYGLDAAVINVSQINALNTTYFADGTAASPSIAFISNNSLGIYKSASNVLGFATTGVERLTLADNVLQYNAGSNTDTFDIDSVNNWAKLTMNPAGNFGPRIVFQYTTATPARHSIRSSHHASTIANNFLDFYLYDTSGVDASGLGTNQVIRIGETATGPNSGLLTIYGITQVSNGTVSAPSYSFSNSTGLGLYQIGSNDLGISAAGVLRLEVNSVVTVGNASNDATTRLYVPLGTQALPSYSFIGNTNTGIFSSATNNIDISCNNTLVTNFSSSGLLNQTPIIIDVGSTAAFVVRQDGAPASGDIFTVDTTNSRVGLGYTNLFVSRQDTYNNSSNQRLLLDSISSNTQINGMNFYNTLLSSTGVISSQINVGKDSLTRNFGNISFFYAGNGSTSNRLSLGISNVSTNLLQIDGSNRVRSNATTFEVSGAAKFESQINVLVGSAGAPSYSFTGSLTDGIYRPAANQVGISTNGVIRQLTTDTYTELSGQLRLGSSSSGGTGGGISLTFSQDGGNNTGIDWPSQNSMSIYCIVPVWHFNANGTAPHYCLNELQVIPDLFNVRLYITDKKLRASSNQTILQQAPAIHLKFLSDPNSNTATQDKSIFGTTVTINGTIAYNTNTVNLTDANGVGLLNMSAIVLPNDSSSYIQTATELDLLKISTMKIILKVKIIAFPGTGNAAILTLYGNPSNNNQNFTFGVDNNSKWFLLIRNAGSIVDSTIGTTTLTTNVWYNFIITCTGGGITVNINGSNDVTTSSYAFNYNIFADKTAPNLRIGSNITTSQNANCYVHEVLLQPTLTTETSNKTFRTQAHEVYTNKLQIADVTNGLVDEGYLLISDKGNNAVWDNSMQIYSSYIQFNSSKVLRAPNGSASLPTYAFSSANDGFYLSGTNTLAFATNGVQRATISTSQLNIASSLNVLINNTTASTSSTTGALIIGGGIGIGNGNSTAPTISWGSVFATPSKQIALFDNNNNNYQYYGFGISVAQLTYTVDSSGADHVFFCGASSSTRNELFRIKGTGVVYAQNGAVGGPAFSFANDPTLGVYRIGSNNMGIATNGVKRIDISDSTTTIANVLQLNSGLKKNATTISGTSATLDLTYNIVLCSYATDATNVTITLPAASTSVGMEYTIIKTGNGGGSVIINTASGSDFIDDASTTTITPLTVQFDKITLVCAQTTRWFSI